MAAWDIWWEEIIQFSSTLFSFQILIWTWGEVNPIKQIHLAAMRQTSKINLKMGKWLSMLSSDFIIIISFFFFTAEVWWNS